MAKIQKSVMAAAATRTAAVWDDAKLSTGIYQRIFETIITGEFAVNTRLPSETELAQRFGASRPVVREALARLRDEGIIVSRQGSGSYVKRRPDTASLQFVPADSIADIERCFEFRVGLEGASAALAAERADSKDLAAIGEAFEELEDCIRNGRLGAGADERFHMAIAKATHNPYHVAVQSSLQPQIVYGMRLLRNLTLLASTARLQRVQDEHRAIVDAIRRKDRNAALKTMQRHIDNARKRMFEDVATA